MFINLESFLEHYGYFAVFIGSMLEGELIVSLAGVFAYQGLLNVSTIFLLSTTATILTEQICFYIGKFLGSRYLHKFTTFQDKINIAFKLLNKYKTLFILCCRFLYGLRIISPFIIGSAKINPLHFSVMNIIASIIWSIISISIGYFGAFASDKLGYSTAGGYVFTIIFILISASMITFFIKQFIKELRNI